jgi:hypothetical protein
MSKPLNIDTSRHDNEGRGAVLCSHLTKDRPTIRVVDFKWYSKPLCEVWRDQRGDP